MVGVLREQDQPAVRQRHLDRRHPGRPARRRHRWPLGRPQADQRAQAAQGPAQAGAARSCTRRRSWAWASWPARTCRPSCTPPRSVKSFFHAAWRVAFHVWDLITQRRGMQLVNGPALIARLVKSADEARRADVGQLPGHAAAHRLGRAVTGAVVQHPDRTGHRPGPPRRACSPPAASRTTSTGGPSSSRAPPPARSTGPWRRRRPPATASRSPSRSAAVLDTSLASPAAWCPVSLVPYRNGRVGTYPHIVDRGKPGLIAVTANGKRFVNEADGYYQFTTGMIDAAPEGEPVQAWLICDHAFQRRYPFGMAKPFPIPTFPYLLIGYLKRGKTLGELAGQVRHRPGRAGADRRRVQQPRPGRRGPGVRPRHAPRSTGAPATPTTARTRRWPRWRRARSTRSRCCPAASARSTGCAPTPTPGCCDADGEPIPGLYVGGQRPGERDGRALPVRRHQHRPGDDVRLHRRPPRRRRRPSYENVVPVPLNDGN